MEMFTKMSREPVIVQRYLPEVRQGDKRIILVDGEAMGAINRVPAEGEARSNMHAGGKPVPSKLTKREEEILRRAVDHNPGPIYDSSMRDIFELILHRIRDLEIQRGEFPR